MAAVPHHRGTETVIERTRQMLLGTVDEAFLQTDHRRLGDAYEPVASERPVIAVTHPRGVIMSLDILMIVRPCLRQTVKHLLRQLAEIEVEMLGINRYARIKRALAFPLHFAEIESGSL